MYGRNLFTVLLATLVIAVLGSGLYFQTSFAQGATPTPSQTQPDGTLVREVTVTGTGEVNVTPDQALVQLGVQTEAESASQALAENNETMQAVIDALVEAGIDRSDIQTQFVNLHPRFSERPPEPGTTQEIVGYTAMNTVEVRVRDLDNLGSILDQAIAAGGNTISGIRFEVGEADELRQQAIEAAMQDARQKAELLADLAGAELGEVISISETGRGGPVFAEEALGVGGAGVPIEPGTQAVQASIQVTWRLAD